MIRLLRQKISALAADQLKRGIAPKKIALTLALAFTLGLFPILGSTTVLCFAAGAAFRLNHPMLQIINQALYPVQILLIPFFIRAGEKLYGAEPIAFNLMVWKDEFLKSPSGFIEKFGIAGVHAMSAWGLVAIPLFGALYWGLLRFAKRLDSTLWQEPL